MTFCKCTKITCVGVAKYKIGFEELRQVSSHSKPLIQLFIDCLYPTSCSQTCKHCIIFFKMFSLFIKKVYANSIVLLF